MRNRPRRRPRAQADASARACASVPTARDALNELKWNQRRLDEAIVSYVHRGAPGDEAHVRGSDILALRASFFDLRDGASIPYHRVLRIVVGGSVVWERRPSDGPPA
jgi:uncharacterized protein (UPF0248 family)